MGLSAKKIRNGALVFSHYFFAVGQVFYLCVDLASRYGADGASRVAVNTSPLSFGLLAWSW